MRVRVITQLGFVVGLLVLLSIQALTLALTVRLRLLAWRARRARRGARSRLEDRVLDIWLRDGVREIVGRTIVLILRIRLVILHGGRIALATLLRATWGRCRPSLLLLLRLLWLLLLLLLEPR